MISDTLKAQCARYNRLSYCPIGDLCAFHHASPLHNVEWPKPERRPPPLPPSDLRTSEPFELRKPAGYVALDERPCVIRQAGDHTWCAKPGCGLSWDTNDPQPPVCPSYAVAVQRRNARQVGEAQRRLSCLYSEPRRRLWGIWPALVALALAGGYLGWTYEPLHAFAKWLTP